MAEDHQAASEKKVTLELARQVQERVDLGELRLLGCECANSMETRHPKRFKLDVRIEVDHGIKDDALKCLTSFKLVATPEDTEGDLQISCDYETDSKITHKDGLGDLTTEHLTSFNVFVCGPNANVIFREFVIEMTAKMALPGIRLPLGFTIPPSEVGPPTD